MFGIGMQEMLIILAVALIILGPKKLPELARTLGRFFAEFQRAAQDLRSSVDLDADDDLKKRAEEKREWEEVKGELPSGAESTEDAEELAKQRGGESPPAEGAS